ncbi:MAG: hypothetical protein C5B50_21655 [Verrucomicrobia bacterium]|nr:MAG: hypothetical protein C5B50_21655 [Verrucomicrobiota bacterium]
MRRKEPRNLSRELIRPLLAYHAFNAQFQPKIAWRATARCRRIWSAVTCHRFGTARHVAQPKRGHVHSLPNLPLMTDGFLDRELKPLYLRLYTPVRNPYPDGMNTGRYWFLLAIVSLAFPICGQQSDTPAQSAEDKAFAAITEQMQKTQAGEENPTDADLKVRREAGLKMSALVNQFLKDYPKSKHIEDAQALGNIGLYEATLAGDETAAGKLQQNATEALKDPKIPEELKLHTFVINHIAQWAKSSGKRNLSQGSAEFEKAYMEGFFAAVDVLPDKEAIFKMLLLQAKSGRELTPAEKRSIAERVAKHPQASAVIKAEAQNILSGRKAYEIGKPLDVSFTAVDGTKVDLKQMKGKVVLVDFWATWCAPCVADVPNLKKVYDAYHAKGFEIIGISLDEKKDELLEFTKKKGMPWPQYFDGKHWNNDLSFRFGISGVPTKWLVDKKGILRRTGVTSFSDSLLADHPDLKKGSLEYLVKELIEEQE